MNKKALRCLIGVLMLCFFAAMITATVSAESLYIKKVVSVVYDDSGSMESESRYSYANYAMQAFAGMLNDQDTLYITYMNRHSGYTATQIPLDAASIDNSVKSIRSYAGKSGGTPFKAVESAVEVLENAVDTNPNTQYWLVVITDGSFDENRFGDLDRNVEELNKKLKKLMNDAKMPNGSDMQLMFFAIGKENKDDPDNSVAIPTERPDDGLHVFHAPDSEKIVGVMSEMADKISGRTRVTDIKKIDDYTIQATSSVALLNIAVLSQKSDATIESVVYGNEIPVTVSKTAYLEQNDNKLFGNVFLLGDSQKHIGRGTYIIKFKKKINVDDIDIMFEPALEVRMKVTVNGEEITDSSQFDEITTGDKISVFGNIYEMGTDTVISSDLLSDETKYEVRISENGKVVKKENGKDLTLKDYTIGKDATEILVSVEIEGFNPIKYSVEFEPKEFVNYGVTAEYGSDITEIDYDDISSNKDMTIVFAVSANGTVLNDKKSVEALKPQITVEPQGNGGSVEITKDGKIIFTPNQSEHKEKDDDDFEVTVTCNVKGVSESKTYKVLVPKTEYTMTADYGSDASEVNYADISSNKDMTIVFSVYADGVLVEDAEKVKALKPEIKVEPKGNNGKLEVSEDGKIIFTPNKSESKKKDEDDFEVKVTCTAGEASADKTYKVITPKTSYTLSVSYKDDVRSVKYANIGANDTLGLIFTVYADGVEVTDPDTVRNMSPKITSEPSGNSGAFTVSQDGKIIFTPNNASGDMSKDSFDVIVTCTAEHNEEKITASGTYTVLVAEYSVVAEQTAEKIVKDGFFGNTVGASFYVTKNGIKLSKADVENSFSVSLNEEFSHLGVSIEVEKDGTIRCTPFDEKEYKLNFFTWWVNWARYIFKLPGNDITVTLSHKYGTESVVIDVVEQNIVYIILNVIVPMLIEIALLVFIIYWICAIVHKPRFSPGAYLYIGSYKIDNSGKMSGKIQGWQRYCLSDYNRFFDDDIWKPTFKAKTRSIGAYPLVSVVPDYAGRIEIKGDNGMPWFQINGVLTPYYGAGTTYRQIPGVNPNDAAGIAEYLERSRQIYFEINRLTTNIVVKRSATQTTINQKNDSKYYIINPQMDKDGINVKEGIIICYANN